MSQKIIVYSATLCGDCTKLKDYLNAQNITYENRDIREHPEFGEELKEKTGILGVPYIVIDGEWKRAYEPGKPFSEDFARSLLNI